LIVEFAAFTLLAWLVLYALNFPALYIMSLLGVMVVRIFISQMRTGKYFSKCYHMLLNEAATRQDKPVTSK